MDYRNWLFKINYHFEGRGWIPPLKKYARKKFMEVREGFADIFNMNIDHINDEWNRLNPDVGYLEEGTDNWDRYNQFVFNKMKPYIDNLNKLHDNWLFKAGMDPETCDFRMISRWSDKVYVGYDMIPVREL